MRPTWEKVHWSKDRCTTRKACIRPVAFTEWRGSRRASAATIASRIARRPSTTWAEPCAKPSAGCSVSHSSPLDGSCTFSKTVGLASPEGLGTVSLPDAWQTDPGNHHSPCVHNQVSGLWRRCGIQMVLLRHMVEQCAHRDVGARYE